MKEDAERKGEIETERETREADRPDRERKRKTRFKFLNI